MKTSGLTILACLGLLALGAPVCIAAELPRSTPEAQGVSSAEILSFIEAANKDIESLHSFMLVRHGHVVAEGWWAPYHSEANHSLYSLSESFTSTAVGLAIAEEKLSLDDPVLKFFAEDAPKEPGDNLKSMRVSDLLRMNTGHQTEPPRKPDEVWARTFLAHPVPFKPGTHFLYNTSATYMQSAIVQKATGTTVLDYLKPRLFEPLGIDHPTWEVSPQGITTGGYGLSIRTGDIARFGQLYLQKGMWEGRQLVPAAWIEAATARQTSNGSSPSSDWDQGYGYQFWRCRHNAYRGDGAFGQYCIVLPEEDAVIAITSGVKDMQSVLNLVWDRLLPAMKPSPLAADADSASKLEQTLKGLSLRPQTGSGSGPGMVAKKFVFPPNEHKLDAITIDSSAKDQPFAFTMRFDGTESRIVCGPGEWTKSRSGWGLFREQPVASSGAWTDDQTFTAKLCFYETPFTITLTLNFKGDELRYDARANMGFGPKNDYQLTGIASGFSRETSGAAVPGTTVPASASTKSPETAPPIRSPDAHDFSKWEKEVEAYEAADRINPPPRGGILFVGSSTIRLWKTLAEDFPSHKVINRGIGGSEIVDATHFAPRIIFPYAPRQIYLRAGGNDIHAGRLPADLANDFADLVRTVHDRLPKTEIFYIAVSPAPSRWGEKDKNRALNELIQAKAVHMQRVGYVDAYDFTINFGERPTVGPGVPRKELFVEDMLHFNPEGYRRLADCVRPFLPTGK